VATFANIIIGTLVLGGVYALIALGFVFIYRSTGLINFAHGEFLAVGAYFAYELWHHSVPGVLAVIVACLGVGLLSGITYLMSIRKIEQQGMFVAVIATMGIAFMLDGLMPVAFGSGTLALPLLPTTPLRISSGVGVTWASVWISLITVAIYAAVVLIDRGSMVGMRMRAAAADRRLASQNGIRVSRTFALAWFAAGVLAAAAGVAYATTSVVSSNLVQVGLAGLPAALVGGFDSVAGTLPGGLVVAAAITVVTTFIGSDASLAATYVILMAFLLVKPQGLFGTKTVERV
jgi:branched-chain amino acid transport system permease protein